MKYIFGLIACVAVLSFRPLGDIYSIAIKSIDGNQIDLNQYKGKKMLFIVLPLSGEDTTVSISQLIELQTKYQSSLVVIGIPSEEAGYRTADADRFKQLYKDASANFIITEGMKVKKGSGQSALFQWLTSKELNRHFDQDVQGVGSKFFVDEAGELYGVMGPQLKLTNPILDRIITRPQVKKQ